MARKEILEFVLDDDKIDELIAQLQDLKENKLQVHFEIPGGQINSLGDINISEFLIHHEEAEEW